MKYPIIYDQIGGTLSQMTFVTFNVYGGGKLFDQRKESITQTILSDNTPDIICLQETTETVINHILKKLPNYYSWTKLDILQDDPNVSKEDIDKVKKTGFIAILSKWKFISKEVIHKGSWYDDGIMKVVVDSRNKLGYNLVIYNVHTIGGSFKLSEEEVLEKRKIRIAELEMLSNDLKNEVGKNIIIGGDFNLDSNNADKYPEANHLPEKIMPKFIDLWEKIRLKDDPGFTESYQNNLFRHYLKPGQNRNARYDKIIYSGNNLNPNSIIMIGNKTIGIAKDKDGKTLKDKDGKDVILFPSDHFGLKAVFKNIN